MSKLKCIFMGTPEISVPALRELYENNSIDLVGVVSMPDRPAGRGKKIKSPEVIEFCKENKIGYTQTDKINNEKEVITKWETESIDIIIVFAFAQFLNNKILQIPNIGCFNIHTSLLPKYRGAAPIQYALLNGDTETGISIQKMVKKMDAGDIAHSKSVSIDELETGGSLYEKLMLTAPLILQEFIKMILNNSLSFTQQDESQASFAPTLKKDDGYIDFASLTSKQIKNKVAALHPWPGTYCYLNKKRLKVLEIEVNNKILNPLEVDITKGILVGCKDASIRLSKIQLEGKKSCRDIDLLNGLKEEIKIG